MAIVPAKDTAALLYKHIVKAAPYGPYGVKAQYRLGEANLALGELEEAERAFQAVVDEYPTSEYAVKARYELARTSLRESREREYHMPSTDEAIKKFEGFKEANPPPDLEQEANVAISQLRQKKAASLYETALFYQKGGKFASARLYYNDILNQFPDTPTAGKAKERLTEIEKSEKGEMPKKPWWRIL